MPSPGQRNGEPKRWAPRGAHLRLHDGRDPAQRREPRVHDHFLIPLLQGRFALELRDVGGRQLEERGLAYGRFSRG